MHPCVAREKGRGLAFPTKRGPTAAGGRTSRIRALVPLIAVFALPLGFFVLLLSGTGMVGGGGMEHASMPGMGGAGTAASAPTSTASEPPDLREEGEGAATPTARRGAAPMPGMPMDGDEPDSRDMAPSGAVGAAVIAAVEGSFAGSSRRAGRFVEDGERW